MTEIEELEQRRSERHERTEDARARVRLVECPKCGSEPLARCRNRAGELRFQNHRERWMLAAKVGLGGTR